MALYRKCEVCGSNLDFGEVCTHECLNPPVPAEPQATPEQEPKYVSSETVSEFFNRLTREKIRKFQSGGSA